MLSALRYEQSLTTDRTDEGGESVIFRLDLC